MYGHLQQTCTLSFATVVDRSIMLVGLGGNNGTTVSGGIIANKLKMSWSTREGMRHSTHPREGGTDNVSAYSPCYVQIFHLSGIEWSEAFSRSQDCLSADTHRETHHRAKMKGCVEIRLHEKYY